MIKLSVLRFLFLLFLTGCTAARVQEQPRSDYSLTIYVDAKHFDYRSAEKCLKSFARQGSFGHAWISLKGIRNGSPIKIEGGHSGELGSKQPRYFDGVAGLVEVGDPNPIRYLWLEQQDGFFQQGSGGHTPTFSACRAITREQFEKIEAYIRTYDYVHYTLSDHQCCSFAVDVASLADWRLDADVTLSIPQIITFRGLKMRLWQDPRYAELTFCTPDRLEGSLKESK